MPPEQQSYRGKLLGSIPVAGNWRLLRLEQSELAATLHPGQRLVLLTDTQRLEAYVAHLAPDWFALLLPPTAAASLPRSGDVLLEGPLGTGWQECRSSAPAVVLAAGAGIAAALALVERLEPAPRLILLGSGGLSFPFRPQPSLFVVGGLPPAAIAAAPVLEGQGIPSRLADPQGRPGCFDGSVVELFRLWRAANPSAQLDVFTCLPGESLTELQQQPALRIRDAL